ncbi:phage tail protein [Herbaspirillum sp.]|uniref:phage tail protein n=1 Tax=Herbaspirillum sp. TaxID=1890675 RepID=UPI0031CFC428
MQSLHRKGENRGQGPADDAGVGARAPDGLGASSAGISTDELEIRASQITAAAVAAAAVTSSVVVTAAEAQAQLQTAPGIVVAPPVAQAPRPQGAWLVSLLTLAAIGLALWWSAQWPWPERALRPMAPHLPALTKHKPVSPAAAKRAAVAPEAATAIAPARDEIALLQQEAEEKAQMLAQKKAAAEARHRREDAALARREQLRREAEAQLAAARTRAESALLAAPGQPAVEAAPAAAPGLAEQVQQCRTLSLFARESCLWKLCNGKWGQDGCPSYRRDNEGA